jgi:RimJ/RimL family protein N-acetyltransferase
MNLPTEPNRPAHAPAWYDWSEWPKHLQHWVDWVPIRRLRAGHRERIGQHLMALDERDRYLRFGHPITDEQIARYVESLDFARDDLFGIFNRRLRLIAVSHLARLPEVERRPSIAELGVSVLPEYRGRRFGGRLFDRAVLHARNQGCERLFIHALSENTAMLKIAAKAGATVQRDGPDSEAWLQLPAENVVTHMSELVEEQAAELNYQWKRRTLQAQRAWHAWVDAPSALVPAASASTPPTQTDGSEPPANTQTGDSSGRGDR